MSARFHIKIATYPTASKIVLKDREHVASVRSFVSFDAAMLYADNLVREERGMPRRLAITRREIRESMTRPISGETLVDAVARAKAYNNPGVHNHAFGDGGGDCPACKHRGQHLQGCRACGSATRSDFVVIS